MVHAKASRPNAIRMLGVDDDTQIGAQAQTLLSSSPVQVVAIPHIAWKRLGKGRPWRTPATFVSALIAALLVLLLPSPLAFWTALPMAAVVGLIVWRLLRHQIPTRIGPAGGLQMDVHHAVMHAMRGSTRHHSSDRRQDAA